MVATSYQRAEPGIIASIMDVPDVDVSGIAQRPRGLSSELELELLCTVQSGSRAEQRRSSLRELIGSYFQVMIAVADLYEPYGLSLAERVAAARIGFLRAIEDYTFGEHIGFSICAVQIMKEHVRYVLAGR